MKKTLGYIVFFIILFIQAGCLLKQKGIDRLWFYTYTSVPAKEEDNEITPASFLYLQKDGSYTRDFGQFEYGKWKRKDSLLLLINNKGVVIGFPIKLMAGNELDLLSENGSVLNFESQPDRSSSATDDPFTIENNQWRIPATKKENEQELKNRLKNHCRFHEVYFKWALDNNLATVDVRSTPSLLKIYGNGFALKKFEELPPAWRSYFYDEEDCRKATGILKDIFDTSDIAWAHTDNRFKMFISAFQQLEQKLK